MPVLILKVTNFCNLNCSYCYMFNQGDTTYAERVRHMSPATVDLVFDRIEEHMPEARTPLHLCLHGGEPTLWKRRSFDRFFERLADHRRRFPRTGVSLQSNFYLYDPVLLGQLREHGISCGISLDGPQDVNDACRVTHKGGASYATILANVERALDDGFGDVLTGFLSVVNPAVTPPNFLAWIGTLPLRPIKLLWPLEYNHSRTPWHVHGVSEADYRRSPRYGAWLRELFDLWWELDDPDIRIVTFREMIAVALGFRHHGDQIVNDCVEIAVIDTGGEYTLHDYWRSVSDRFVVTEMTVRDHSIDDFLTGHPLTRALLDLESHLPEECENCAVKEICGGGLLSGRAEAGSVNIRRKSVMCYDQFEIYGRVASVTALGAGQPPPVLVRPDPPVRSAVTATV